MASNWTVYAHDRMFIHVKWFSVSSDHRGQLQLRQGYRNYFLESVLSLQVRDCLNKLFSILFKVDKF